jgi:DNA-binding NtrC family response regulator
MQGLAAGLARVAATEVPVLIGGETGSGKSTLARQVHEDSPRRNTPLVVLHSPTTTLEAVDELASLGAVNVLIEEVGELSAQVQDALVRVLSMQPRRSGIRLIATTSRDLNELTQRHGLRADLLYRLDVVRLDIPPLRQRPDDIIFLAEHFLMLAVRSFKREIRALSPDACEHLLSYRWPGNVRELSNCITESVLYCAHIRLRAGDLRLRASLGVIDPEAELAAALARLHAVQSETFYHHSQRVLFRWALQTCRGNRVRTAAFLGIGRGALRAKLRRFGLGPTEIEESAPDPFDE